MKSHHIKPKLLDAIVIEPDDPPNASIIWLHGLGADGNDFVSMAEDMNLPQKFATRMIFPHAPRRPVTVNGGQSARAWYDIKTASIASLPDWEGIGESVTQIHELIKREESLGIPSERIILAGFSQGGVIALYAGLSHLYRMGGIICMSGYLPDPKQIELSISPANHYIAIYMAHGQHDEIIPITIARASKDKLKELYFRVRWEEYDMGHSVADGEIIAIREWIIKTFMEHPV